MTARKENEMAQADYRWKKWQCIIMNFMDFRYWFCDCHYEVPYGKVIMGGCPKHD